MCVTSIRAKESRVMAGEWSLKLILSERPWETLNLIQRWSLLTGVQPLPRLQSLVIDSAENALRASEISPWKELDEFDHKVLYDCSITPDKASLDGA